MTNPENPSEELYQRVIEAIAASATRPLTEDEQAVLRYAAGVWE